MFQILVKLNGVESFQAIAFQNETTYRENSWKDHVLFHLPDLHLWL